MLRSYIVILHRYLGLMMAGFLIITSLSGAVLVWYDELDSWINADLMRVEPQTPPSQPLSPFLLREKVAQHYPDAAVNWMMVAPPKLGRSTRFDIEPMEHPGSANPSQDDEVFINPYSGEILGSRQWGNLSQGLTNLMPFIYRLHYSLALRNIGTWLLGGIALLWMVDCFFGVYLTLPRRSKSSSSNRWQRWQAAWKIRWLGGKYKLNYDLHSAASLWLWLMLFIFALSSVAMTLQNEVYKPVMSHVLSFQQQPAISTTDIHAQPVLAWPKSYQAAVAQTKALTAQKGIEVKSFERFAYYPDKYVFKLMVTTDRDINQRFGQSWIYIDASSGELQGYFLPTGEASGDTFTTWINTFHIAAIWGLPYRIFVSFIGCFVTLVCITGILIWWRKRLARLSKAQKQTRKIAETIR